MTIVEFYETGNPVHWNILVPLYLFVLSVSTGVAIVLSFSQIFKVNVFQSVRKQGLLIGLVMIASAPIFLILDLGQPLRFWYTINPMNFQYSSPMSWGGVFLIVFGLIMLYVNKDIFLKKLSKQTLEEVAATTSTSSKGIEITLFIVALLLATYPGVELGILVGKQLWNSELLPIYFISTTILAGISVLGLVLPLIKGDNNTLSKYISTSMILFILLSFILIASRSLIIVGAGATGFDSLKLMWSNQVFLFGEVIVGLLAPLVLVIFGKTKKNHSYIALASILVLIGVFAMRYALIFTQLAML